MGVKAVGDARRSAIVLREAFGPRWGEAFGWGALMGLGAGCPLVVPATVVAHRISVVLFGAAPLEAVEADRVITGLFVAVTLVALTACLGAAIGVVLVARGRRLAVPTVALGAYLGAVLPSSVLGVALL